MEDDARDYSKEENAKSHKMKKMSRHHDFIADINVDGDDGGAAHDKKKRKKEKKKEKKRKKRDDVGCAGDDQGSHCQGGEDENQSSRGDRSLSKKQRKDERRNKRQKEMDERIVSSSAIEYYSEDQRRRQYALPTTKEEKGMMVSPSSEDAALDSVAEGRSIISDAKVAEGVTTSTNGVTLLLFYQYVEPPWDDVQFANAYNYATNEATTHGITGRMRIAREGMNCTLTGTYDGIRSWCAAMRTFDGGRATVDPISGIRTTEFSNTEFKLTDDLPPKQRFPKLHAFEVVELVNYGLTGSRAPLLAKHGGTHLEPQEYHVKMCESNTVIIDVRNHYEAKIGHFDPPTDGAQMIDPKMRKSTEFPVWLDKKETKEMLRGKQVLMYCTGGVRCERASALLKQKMEEEEDTKQLGIRGVFQLQGGIDKYFKHYPTGGLWRGKNYVFDKRFAHAPPAIEAVKRTSRQVLLGDDDKINEKEFAGDIPIPTNAAVDEIMGNCEACSKPWDMYRGKRRCPTCGVPSLICRECFELDKAGAKKLGIHVRCDLCVIEDVRSNSEMRRREDREIQEYEYKLQEKILTAPRKPKPNPERITRLFLKNMCAKQMDQRKLLEMLHPATVTHIQWLTDRNTGKFYGSAFIEVQRPDDAGSVVALDGMVVFGRRITVKYQKADEKDVWPIPNTKVQQAS